MGVCVGAVLGLFFAIVTSCTSFSGGGSGRLFCPQGYIWQCLGTFLIVAVMGVFMAFGA